jgi:hypothetical protein
MKIIELIEGFAPGDLRDDIKDTLPPTIVIPDLQNNDAYTQYRYLVAMASAKAVENGEVQMDQASAWNENISVVCYTPEEEQIAAAASKMMGVNNQKISSTRSQEPKNVNTTSPVRKFKDIE